MIPTPDGRSTPRLTSLMWSSRFSSPPLMASAGRCRPKRRHPATPCDLANRSKLSTLAGKADQPRCGAGALGSSDPGQVVEPGLHLGDDLLAIPATRPAAIGRLDRACGPHCSPGAVRRQHRMLVRPASDVALRVRRCHLRAGAGRGVQPARWAGEWATKCCVHAVNAPSLQRTNSPTVGTNQSQSYADSGTRASQQRSKYPADR